MPRASPAQLLRLVLPADRHARSAPATHRPLPTRARTARWAYEPQRRTPCRADARAEPGAPLRAARGPPRRLPDRCAGSRRASAPTSTSPRPSRRTARRPCPERRRRRTARRTTPSAGADGAGARRAAGLRRRRAGESIAREIEAMSADASGTLPGLIDVAIARRRAVLPRGGAARRARAVTHDRRAHARPGEAVTILAPVVVAVARTGAHRVRARAPRRERRPSRRRWGVRGCSASARCGAFPPTAPSDRRCCARPRGARRPARRGRRRGRTRRALEPDRRLLREPARPRPFVPCERRSNGGSSRRPTPEPVRGSRREARPVAPARAITRRCRRAASVGRRRSTRASCARRRACRASSRWRTAPTTSSTGSRTAADVDRVEGGRRRILAAVRGRGRSVGVGALVGGGALVLMLTLVPPATAGDVAGRRCRRTRRRRRRRRSRRATGRIRRRLAATT